MFASSGVGCALFGMESATESTRQSLRREYSPLCSACLCARSSTKISFSSRVSRCRVIGIKLGERLFSREILERDRD